MIPDISQSQDFVLEQARKNSPDEESPERIQNMNHAITTLQLALDTARNNEPIQRAEGDIEQADLNLERIGEYELALGLLEGASHPGQAHVSGVQTYPLRTEVQLQITGKKIMGSAHLTVVDKELLGFFSMGNPILISFAHEPLSKEVDAPAPPADAPPADAPPADAPPAPTGKRTKKK